VLLVVCGLGIAYQFVYMAADHAYLLSRVALQGPARTESAIKAMRLNPYNDMYRAEIGLAYTDEIIDNLNAASQAQQQGQDPMPYQQAAAEKIALAEAAFLSTIKFVPWEYDNYVFLANLYNLAGQTVDPSYYEKAVEIARRGVEVERYGPAIRTQLARALISTGKTDEAVKELEYAVKMDPVYAEGGLLLAQLYEQDGRLNEAIALLKGIDAQKPGQTGVAETIRRLEASATAQ